MKTLYVLTTSMMNGTVTMNSSHTIFLTRELAEEAAKAVEAANANSFFPAVNSISECNLYESREEVPILNRDSNGNE
jgi:hypothetical protein